MTITKSDYLIQLNEICKKVSCKVNNIDYNNIFTKRLPERVRADKFRACYLYFSIDTPYIFSLAHISNYFWQDRTTLYNYIDNHWDNLKYDTDYKRLWEYFVILVIQERKNKGLNPQNYNDLHYEFDELSGIYEYSNNITREHAETIVFIEQFIKKNNWRLLREAKICTTVELKAYKLDNKFPKHWLSYIVIEYNMIEFVCKHSDWIKQVYPLLPVLEEDFKNYCGYYTKFKLNNWESNDLRELFAGELPYATI